MSHAVTGFGFIFPQDVAVAQTTLSMLLSRAAVSRDGSADASGEAPCATGTAADVPAGVLGAANTAARLHRGSALAAPTAAEAGAGCSQALRFRSERRGIRGLESAANAIVPRARGLVTECPVAHAT
jgi:hypothetical protein